MPSRSLTFYALRSVARALSPSPVSLSRLPTGAVLGFANLDLWFNLNTLGAGLLVAGALAAGGCGAQIKKKKGEVGEVLNPLNPI